MVPMEMLTREHDPAPVLNDVIELLELFVKNKYYRWEPRFVVLK